MTINEEQGKLIKVTFEYENTIETLEGETARKWLTDTKDVCVFAHFHGQNPFETKTGKAKYRWKVTKKGKK